MKDNKADNKKNSRKVVITLIIILAVILIVSVLGIIYVSRPSETNKVEIVSNNKVLYELNLSTEKNRTFDIESSGGVNTVEIKNGKIRVKSADCPDKVCVDSGWLESSDLPIVCLPNKLIIRFSGETDDIDSVSK